MACAMPTTCSPTATTDSCETSTLKAYTPVSKQRTSPSAPHDEPEMKRCKHQNFARARRLSTSKTKNCFGSTQAQWGHLLAVDVVHTVLQAQGLELEEAARLQELPHDAVRLTQVPLQQEHPPPLLHTMVSCVDEWYSAGK